MEYGVVLLLLLLLLLLLVTPLVTSLVTHFLVIPLRKQQLRCHIVWSAGVRHGHIHLHVSRESKVTDLHLPFLAQ
jgi:hypothetical protein